MKQNILSDFLDLLYPRICVRCEQNLLRDEEYLCLGCLHQIPKTNYHLERDNPLEKLFWGKVPITHGTAFFFFQKGSAFQNILHQLKYNGEKEIGYVLGKYAAADLLNSPEFQSVDFIVPVPLHAKKFKQRGYNQSEWIALGLAQTLKKTINTSELIRFEENISQTQKSVYERHKNTKGIFRLKSKTIFDKKHILLVDDIITTGATLEGCIQALLETEEIKISVFTLAIA